MEYEKQIELDMGSQLGLDKEKLDIKHNYMVEEGFQNIDRQKMFVKTPVLYGEYIQLYNEATKRFLCVEPVSNEKIKFKNQTYDENNKLYMLGFSQFPSEYTHFKLEACFPSGVFERSQEFVSRKDVFLIWEKETRYFLTIHNDICLMNMDERLPLTPRLIKDQSTSAMHTTQEELRYVSSHSL